jgi:hypothetical protein
MPLLAKVPFVLVLMAVAGFCAFGFLATFEPPGFLVLRAAYGVAALACVGGIVWILARPAEG